MTFSGTVQSENLMLWVSTQSCIKIMWSSGGYFPKLILKLSHQNTEFFYWFTVTGQLNLFWPVVLEAEASAPAEEAV